MELRGNLQKNKEVDIYNSSDELETVRIPYGIIDQDHNLMLDFGLTHAKNYYKGRVGLEVDMYNPEGKDYFVDLTDIKKKRISTFISYVDLNFYSDYFNSYLYKWRGHRESTDLLTLYKCDWDLQLSRYLGIYSPVGVEVTGNKFLKGLFVGVGQTPALVNQSTVYMEYARKFSFIEPTLIYQERTTPYLDLSDANNITVYDLTKKYVEGIFTFPEFPNSQYIYNERVIALDTKVNTYYHSLQFELAKYDVTQDAYYYGAKLETSAIFPDLLKLILMYENADKYAGNRKEYSVESRVSPVRALTFSAKYDERKPHYGPLFNNLLSAPLVYDNREARIIEGSITWDTTRPTSISHWNANFIEDAPLAVKCSYQYTDYPTYTDNPVLFDWNENKYTIFGIGKGLYPCKLHKFSTKLISNHLAPYKIILYFDTGIKQAEWPTDVAVVPWTENYSSYIEFRKQDDFLIGCMFLIDDWEVPQFGSYDESWEYRVSPLDYNKEIGIPWDYYLGARIVKFFGLSSIELKYQYIVIDGKFNDKYEKYMDAVMRADMLKERMNEISMTYKVMF